MSINGTVNSLKEQNKNLDDQPDRDLERQTKIRALNDRLRQTGRGGVTQITASLAVLDPDRVFKILRAVAAFDAFSPANDPWGEHDCAALQVDDLTIFWKIDYYDRSRSCRSPNPADPALTVRILTIMLASDY
jgi:hypothetical protein